MNIKIVPKWVMPLGYGFTFYKTIFIREDAQFNRYVIKHEMCHVRQWERIGKFKFPFLYLVELIKNGYKNNKYEIEARKYGEDKD